MFLGLGLGLSGIGTEERVFGGALHGGCVRGIYLCGRLPVRFLQIPRSFICIRPIVIR